jgi:hypothetical protein
MKSYHGNFFGVLNGKKKQFHVSIENKAEADKLVQSYQHYDLVQLLVPGIKGYDNWYYGDETEIVSPLNWTITQEPLHLSNNSIQGKVSAKSNFALKFKNKVKKYKVEITFDVNIYISDNDIIEGTEVYIKVKGNTRRGYGKKNVFISGVGYVPANEYIFKTSFHCASFDIYTGEVHIHPYLEYKESFYTHNFGGFIANKQIVDNIYDMFLQVCNMMSMDSNKNYKGLKIAFDASRIGA